LKDNGLVRSEHVTLRDPEEQRIANLSCGTADRDPDGGLGHFGKGFR
jgi:hypothetical protein